MLKQKCIVIGITGGIAAYKLPLLVRELVKAGAETRVVMTEAAQEFVTPLTLSTLSGHDVILGTFPRKSSSISSHTGTWHIDLAQRGDLMVIAPATANVMAKLAHGYADDAVSTLALAFRKQVIVSPAMDLDMWQHPATQSNVSLLEQMGYIILPPDKGELASGLVGPGRLPEITAIVQAIESVFARSTHSDLRGKRVLITAGPTYEAIDPVRFIGNHSSGKMGFALARAAAERGASVTLIAGPVHLPTPRNVLRYDVSSAADMYAMVMKHRRRSDLIIMAAAVADFTPLTPSQNKIKKESLNGQGVSIELSRTKDILKELGARKNGAVLVGFALETERSVENARKKLREKNADLLILNNATEEGAGFNTDTNIVTILFPHGKIQKLAKMTKFEVAHNILNRAVVLLNRRKRVQAKGPRK